jgi:choline kinase
MTDNFSNNKPITTALLLAAGLGCRLNPLTKRIPKCLTAVNGITILERLVVNLKQIGIRRLVVVTGHGEQYIRDFLGTETGDLKIEYVFSSLYKETNNIYSLWLARKVINEQFLIVESDLVFDKSLLNAMLTSNKIAVAKMQTWMNGTCVTLNNENQVKAFYSKKVNSTTEQLYKTVNVYSISLDSWLKIIERLENFVAKGDVNHYYEVVFAEMIQQGTLSFEAVSFDLKPWYEIDTLEDLMNAEALFNASKPSSNKTIKISNSTYSKEIFQNNANADKEQKAS